MPRADSNSPKLMDRLLGAIEELHSSPIVACKVVELLKDPEFEVGQIEKHLEADPALCAAILRLVNSSSFGVSQRVASLQQAITLLGTRALRLTVLSFGLVHRLTRGAPAKLCADFWRRALTMAVAASRLCAGRNDARPDEAYLAGLLADVGVLALSQVETNAYVPLYEQCGHGRRLVEAERRQFGFDHPALGERLLSGWQLPEPLTSAVAQHHGDPREGGILQQAVRAGDLLADGLWMPQTPRLPEAQRFLLSEFGLDLDGFISLAVQCREDISENAALFQVELIGSIDCDALARSALCQYKAEALETAMDMDSLTAIMEHEFG